jgi:hypothetical protein
VYLARLTFRFKDNYRITQFVHARARNNFDGQRLQIQRIPEGRRPHPDLLREHFLQCVLCHAKGTGAPAFELDYDFGPGDFSMGDEDRWASGDGKSMMEVEVARRIYSAVAEMCSGGGRCSFRFLFSTGL